MLNVKVSNLFKASAVHICRQRVNYLNKSQTCFFVNNEIACFPETTKNFASFELNCLVDTLTQLNHTRYLDQTLLFCVFTLSVQPSKIYSCEQQHKFAIFVTLPNVTELTLDVICSVRPLIISKHQV
jgi:hypothetical protein